METNIIVNNNFNAIIPINYDLIKIIAPKCNNTIVQGLIDTFNKYANYFKIDDQYKVGQFLAQSCHESDHYKTTTEYASGVAYEGRKDLGNIVKGDGVLFKGRGLFQTTGRNNYKKANQELLELPFLPNAYKLLLINDGLLKNPKLLQDPILATLSALIYWKDKDLNKYALPLNKQVSYKRFKRVNGKLVSYLDNMDAEEAMCRAINGGLNGFNERKRLYSIILKEFNKKD